MTQFLVVFFLEWSSARPPREIKNPSKRQENAFKNLQKHYFSIK